MLMRCVSCDASKSLTVGKIYDVLDDTDDNDTWCQVVADDRVQRGFFRHRFEAVPYLGSEPVSDAAERKAKPICTGVLDYFPDALAAVAICSRVGNEQHNPGQPLHWAKEKSTDHADALLRHLVDRGTVDTDGVLHSAKVAWRALALLQTELENAKEGK